MLNIKKYRIIAFAIIILICIYAIISCNLSGPWTDAINGAGIWGVSKYGEAVFGDDGEKPKATGIKPVMME